MHPTRALRSINWPVLVSNVRFAYRVTRGNGVDGHHDGLIYKNVLAGYAHLHALGAPDWAEGFVKAARLQKTRLGGSSHLSGPQVSRHLPSQSEAS